jgi:hypothetical protein
MAQEFADQCNVVIPEADRSEAEEGYPGPIPEC